MAAKKTSKKASLTAGQKVGIGVGLTAAAVAAAGTYFLAGSKDAKQNRKKVKSWMLKAKAEVLEGLENAQEMTEEEFHQLVGAVTGAYAGLKDASKADIADFKKEMKEHWPKIVKEGKALTKTVAKVVSTTKAAPKKAAKKAPAKKSAPKKATKKAAKKAA